MSRKLRCVLVDDDNFMHGVIKDLCKSIPGVELTESFLCPREFLQSANSLNYDVCLLDLVMPKMNGLIVARQLKGKQVIFITGEGDKLRDAIEFAPLDILMRPIKKERLNKALDKALDLIAYKKNQKLPEVEKRKEYDLFNTAEIDEKVRLFVPDIYFVTPDSVDSRNKRIIMKNGEKYTLMDCNFERLMGRSPNLIRVNKSELVSVDAVQRVRHDLIVLKCLDNNGVVKHVTLNRIYRKAFMNRLSI